jgi:hypothetical protein
LLFDDFGFFGNDNDPGGTVPIRAVIPGDTDTATPGPAIVMVVPVVPRVRERVARRGTLPGDVRWRGVIVSRLRMWSAVVRQLRMSRVAGRWVSGGMMSARMVRGMSVSTTVPASGMGVPATVRMRGTVRTRGVSTAVSVTATLAETRLVGQEGQTDEGSQSERKEAFHSYSPRHVKVLCLAKRPSPAVESRAREFRKNSLKFEKKMPPGP